MLQYYCYHCKYEWDSKEHVEKCPVCGSTNLTPLRGYEIKTDNWHPVLKEKMISMFIDTPFIFKSYKNNCIEYGAGYGKALVRKIFIDFQEKRISYIRLPVLTRGKFRTVKFEKLSDIVIPKTFEEFDEIIR